MAASPPLPAGIILAGGQARRMGGCDKGLLPVGGQTMLARVASVLRPQVAELALSANGDPARFGAYGLPVLADAGPGQLGPLAGVLAGLDWAATTGATILITAPWDCPFLPHDLVPRLMAAAVPTGFAAAASDGRHHPAVALWPVSCRVALRAALLAGERRVGAFGAERGLAVWDAVPHDPFLNVNGPADLATAERLAGNGSAESRTWSR